MHEAYQNMNKIFASRVAAISASFDRDRIANWENNRVKKMSKKIKIIRENIFRTIQRRPYKSRDPEVQILHPVLISFLN